MKLRGKINSLTHDFTNQLFGVTYKSRVDVSSNWASHTTLANLQTWINANITGDELTGTKYWVKCHPVYKPGYDDEAVNVLNYSVLYFNQLFVKAHLSIFHVIQSSDNLNLTSTLKLSDDRAFSPNSVDC